MVNRTKKFLSHTVVNKTVKDKRQSRNDKEGKVEVITKRKNKTCYNGRYTYDVLCVASDHKHIQSPTKTKNGRPRTQEVSKNHCRSQELSAYTCMLP